VKVEIEKGRKEGEGTAEVDGFPRKMTV